MSKDKISDYSATANSNTDIAGINIDEGCAPSGINNAIRTLMKQLKDWQSGSQDVYITPAGSVSAPAVTTTGDTNTGVYFPAADKVAIATGGIAAVTVDSSQNVGIGASNTYGFKQHISAGASTFGQLISGTTTGVYTNWSDGTATNSPAVGGIGNNLVFATGTVSNSERARIDSSGNLLVGTTSAGGTGGVTFYTGAETWWNRTATGTFIAFRYNSTTVGSISTNGTTTTYATSSDYRLKEDIVPMTGALSTVAQLKPCTYTWKSNGESTQGFIAHELQEVVPECVIGEKDAVDADGNPVYQGIDTSFLVATLTAAIQEQQALITTLTERITALEQA